MNQKNVIPFAERAKEFITASCRQRLFLNRTGKSKNMDDRSHDIATGILNDIPVIYGDRAMADYILKKAYSLLSLLPGKKCKGIEKRMAIYNSLISDAKAILQPPHPKQLSWEF